MTMGTKPATAAKNGVNLIRPGVEKEEFVLSEETTLAGLFRWARVQTEGHVVLIDGKPRKKSSP
jgi:hypothetical protein